MAWEKGVAQTVDVPTWKDGILTAPSGTVTATIIKDGAGPIALNGTVVKIGTSPAVHLALSATDTNCNCGLVLITDPGLAIDDMPFSFATESEYSAARAGYLTGAVATAATQTTILARIGDFAGTGLNSAKGFLQAMFRKDAGVTGANTPSEINEAENTVVGGFDGTTDSQEAIRDRGDAAWITATGFATPTNVSDAQTAITNVLTAIKGAGWSSETLKLIYDSLPSAGSGAFPITLYVKDLSANPIQNAKVRINATGGDAVQTTNSLGVVTFNLDAGTYTAYVGTSASYTPAASYTVVISGAGAITSPAGGILTVTAISLPVPTSADNYLVYNNERKVEADVAFGAAGMTVKITDLSFSGRVDAAANACRSIIGTTYSTDAAGQWSFELAKTAFVAGAYLTIEKTWTDSSGTVTESQKAKLVAPATGATVAWADLSPSVV